MKIEIKDASEENIMDIIMLCVPPDKKDDPLFKRGIAEKKKWAQQMLKKYGSFAKVAYVESKAVGFIQFKPIPDKKLVEIDCIFVPNRDYQHKGIGKLLLNAFLEDMKNPKPYFGNDIPYGVITYAFETPAGYPQHKFYKKMGFRHASKDDPFLLYYPLKENFVYTPSREFIPQEEDRGKALIFMDPNCPYCIHFVEGIKKAIKTISDKVSIRVINVFEEEDEIKKRGTIPFCAVNQRPIKSFYLDKENFEREVKEALNA